MEQRPTTKPLCPNNQTALVSYDPTIIDYLHRLSADYQFLIHNCFLSVACRKLTLIEDNQTKMSDQTRNL